MFHLLLAIIYLAFISLGLPDSLLGSAWPTMYQQFDVPVSYAGIISMIIALGTIFSSLQSDRLTRRFGTAKVTAVSVGITATALFGFSISNSFWMLVLLAIPYGLGAGGVDASLNNYVALHYSSKHMSWLHCMWGVGASVGPYIMSYAMTGGKGWNMGYRYISFIQIALTIALFISLPLWKKNPGVTPATDTPEAKNEKNTTDHGKSLTLKEIFAIPGAKEVLITFFCYCALEQTTGLWASSYLALYRGLTEEVAASYAALFFLGITLGRGISGFVTMKLSDTAMIRLGQAIILLGIIAILLPFSTTLSLIGLVLIGLGCAPVYPCIIHSTPSNFGADRSQALIGVQMAFAYIGTCLMPPVFGLIANYIHISLFPFFLLAILVLMYVMYEKMLRKV